MNKLSKVIIVLTSLLFSINVSAKQNIIPDISVIPKPDKITSHQSSVTLPENLTIAIQDNDYMPASMYINRIFQNYNTDITSGNGKADIIITKSGRNMSDGEYELTITDNGTVTISSSNYPGIINGLTTLRQLLPAGIENAGGAKAALTLPVVEISDAPRYKWRGMMLDSVRHFWTVDEVKRFIDMMVLYKFNVFHWHLIDDEGWRVEINRYPELTEKGAFRQFDQHDIDSEIKATEEHDNDLLIPRDRMKVNENGDSVYGGFYTQQELRNIVEYAKNLGIEIIPEFDLPGHSTMLTRVMPQLSCDGTPHNSVCAGKDVTLEICKNIYSEIFDIFPSKYIHIGGDEVNKERWKKCSDCQKRIKEEEIENVDGLQAWFIRQMELFFRLNNRKLIGWDEISNDGLSSESAIMWWRADYPEMVSAATTQGKKLVFSPTRWYYFDSFQDEHSSERILDFDPVDWLNNEKDQKLIMGIQANIWTEYIPTVNRLDYMAMPRMIALSETAWNSRDKRLDHENFWKTVQPHFTRLEKMGVNFQIPPVRGIGGNNVFIDKIEVVPYSEAKDYTLRYTTDGSIPTAKSKKFNKPIVIKNDCVLTVAPFHPNGKRSGYAQATYTKGNYFENLDVNPTKDGLNARWFVNRARNCATVDRGDLIKEFPVNEIEIPEEVNENRAIILEGYMYAPTDGYYIFSTTSDDGSNMTLDGKLILDNDGYHVPVTKDVKLPLRKGWHKLEIRYFDFYDKGATFYGSIECDTDPSQKVTFKH